MIQFYIVAAFFIGIVLFVGGLIIALKVQKARADKAVIVTATFSISQPSLKHSTPPLS
ncbi:MAG: hypothetical protein KGI54_17755 [Pseudomonadota bacterium]|nr:hypothetical protein [Pseudomonadota bacterium]